MTLPNVRYYDNDAFEASGELESLLRAGAKPPAAISSSNRRRRGAITGFSPTRSR